MSFVKIKIILELLIPVFSISLATKSGLQKMVIMEGDKLNSLFYEESENKFIEQPDVTQRQFVVFNENSYVINITISAHVESDFCDAYISYTNNQIAQGVHIFYLTLVPEQSYQFTVNYNCTKEQTVQDNMTDIFIDIDEQTFKYNTKVRDELRQYSIQYLKKNIPNFDFIGLIEDIIFGVLCLLLIQFMLPEQSKYRVTHYFTMTSIYMTIKLKRLIQCICYQCFPCLRKKKYQSQIDEKNI